MRRTYRQNKKTGKFEEVHRGPSTHHHFVRDDVQPFVSPVDGSIINSASDLRHHNERNNVVSHAEYGDQWKQKAKERQDKAFGRKSSEQRKRDLAQAVDQHRSNEYSTYQNYVDDYR